MTESERNYLLTKLKEKCKVFYYKESLHLNSKNKNPLDMNDKELMTFVDKHNLHSGFAEVLRDCTLKFWTIQNKFKKVKIPDDVLTILDRLLEESSNSYLVGGCTRDIILGEEVKDYDFVTDIAYNRLREIFSECKFKETGTEFLVFNLNYNGTDYEIANFRKDSETSADSRRPDSVQIGTIEDDCMRRDFTCNNIFWNPKELYITPQSVDDILNRTLRFVGNQQRLKEDTLRGIRFYRLLKTKNLEPDKESLRAVRRNWKDIISSNEHRIMLEIEKICLK